MSVDLISVFVRSDVAIETFAAELERVLGIRFNPEDMAQLGLNPDYYAYVFRNRDFKRWFGIVKFYNDLEDDGDKHFSHYNYEIEVGAFATPDGSEREIITQEFARLIFEKLKALNKYPLMMVRGVHPKLDQFEPTSEIAP